MPIITRKMSSCWTLVFSITFFISGLRAQDCQTIFTVVASNSVSKGASPTADSTSAACEQSCRSNSACLSYQLDNNLGHQLCWIQTQANAFQESNLYTDMNINEYKKSTICDGCKTVFTVVADNTVSKGASPTSDLTSAACEQNCRNNSACLSYQLDTNTGHQLCWIQTKANAFDQGNLYRDPNINEFKKNTTCNNCFVDFTSSPNYATRGATLNSNINNAQDCRAFCVSQDTCLSYQIDTSSGSLKCWIQTNIVDKTNYLNLGVTEYTKFKNCSNASPPPCQYIFEERTPGFSTVGATSNALYTTRADCEAACLAQSTCISYQLDLNQGSILCWLQSSNGLPYQRANIREFFKVCPSQTTTVSSTLGSSSTGGCPPTFIPQKTGSVSYGAIPRANLSTPDACRSACASSSSCVSYQIDMSPGSTTLCWIQNDITKLDLLNIYTSAGVQEFFKDTTYCLITSTGSAAPCSPSFNNPVTNNVSSGATLKSDIKTDEECRKNCLASPSCVSYQIQVNVTDHQCWIQENRDNLLPSNLVIRPSIIEYIKNTTYCLYTSVSSTGTPCNIVFIPQEPNRGSYGAIQNTSFTTSDACRSACFYDPSCLSYQLNLNYNPILCWLQFNSFFLNGTKYGQPGVTEYIKSCSSGSTAVTTEVTTKSSFCLTQYRANTPNRGSMGAQYANNITSYDGCMAACTSDSTCVAFQLDVSKSFACWLQRNASALLKNYSLPGVTEYIKYCLESTTTAPSSCSNVIFQVLGPNRGTLGAQQQSGLDENQCRLSCQADPTCLSYQINSNPNSIKCWFQKIPKNYVNDMFYQSGVQEYQKICVATTSSVSAPGCFITYQQNAPNNASLGASPNPSTTEDQCRQSCSLDTTCVSYQIDNNNIVGQRCWIQRSLTLRFFSRNNVTEYIKIIDCAQTSVTMISTSLTSSTPGVTFTTAAIVTCSAIYQVQNPGFLSRGATSQSTLDSVTCEGNCTSNPMCVSYQIVDSICWHQMDARNLLPDSLFNTGLVYFEYTKICTKDCLLGITFFEDVSGYISLGADQKPLLNEAQCKDACQADNDCKSYQIERSSGAPACWLQRNSSPFVKTNLYQKTPSITEYRKFCGTWYGPSTTSSTTTAQTTSTRSSSASPRTTPAPRITTPPKNVSSPVTSQSSTINVVRPNTTSPTTSTSTTTTTTQPTTSGCQTVYTWSQMPNSNMPGGEYNRATSLKGCQDACIALDSCVGIDLDGNFNPPYCFLFMSSVALTPYPGVTHYYLVRSSQQGCITSTTTTPPISTTCPTMVKSYGMNADAGEPAKGAEGEDVCLSKCIADPLCLSADYVLESRTCYTHKTRTGFEDQANSCCIRFSKCTGPNQPLTCREQFSEFNGQGADVLTSYSQLTLSLDDCKGRCLTTNCTSFNYLKYSSSCYLFRGVALDITARADSTIYIRNFCLNPVELPSSTTSTTPVTPSPGQCLMDLALLLDNSGSIMENTDRNNWELLKTFAQEIASKPITYGYYLDHMAVVTFSDTANTAFDFNKLFPDISGLLAAIKSLPFVGSKTNTPAALNEGRRLFQDQSRGSRPNSVHVMVLITDGVVSPDWASDFLPAVAQLSPTDIRRFVLGVGNLVSMDQLRQIASPGGLAWVPSFSSIGDAMKNLSIFINQFSCTPVIKTPTISQVPPTPSTASSSTSTTTTTTTTAPYVPAYNIDCTFGASLSTNLTGPSVPLRVDVTHGNRLNGLTMSNGSCRISFDYSNSVVEICAGIPPMTMVQLQTFGGFPAPIGFDWLSTSNDDVETGCRSAVVGISRGTDISWALRTGNLLSPQMQSGWNSFSVTNIILNPNWLFSGYVSREYSGYNVLQFPNPNVNPTDGIFNTAENTYECRNGGYYYFSFSAGVPATQAARIVVENLNKTYSAQRLSLANGLTTISRSMLVPCNGKVKLALRYGTIVPGSNNLISFTAFPYNTRSGVIAWSAFRSAGSSESDPLSFDDWVINVGIKRSDMSSVVILTGGYYYVYVSIGTVPTKKSSVTLMLNGNPVVALERRSALFTGVDVLGRGVVLNLQPNDLLKVVVGKNFSISSEIDGYQTSFFGMFLET